MTLPCGCEPDASGYGYCGECTRKLREKIWKGMSEKKKRYDRQFAPEQSKGLDDAKDKAFDEAMDDIEHNTCCSCHINPPCSYCTRDIDNE